MKLTKKDKEFINEINKSNFSQESKKKMTDLVIMNRKFVNDFMNVFDLKPSDNNDFKKVLIRPDCPHVFEFECQKCKERIGKWEMENHVCLKPSIKS